MTPPNMRVLCLKASVPINIFDIEETLDEYKIRPNVTCLSQNFKDVFCVFPQIVNAKMSYSVSYNITNPDDYETKEFTYGEGPFSYYQKNKKYLHFPLNFISMEFSHYIVVLYSTHSNVTTSQTLEFDLDEIGMLMRNMNFSVLN